MILEIGKKYQIHSYKHDGSIHRAWDEAVLLEENDTYYVFGNKKTKVTEKVGSVWKTKEPAIMYFFKDKWYNIISQLKKDGLYYYCNIASPFIVEEDTIKYIDYDLDLRVFPTGRYKVLDRSEFAFHAKKMKYPTDLVESIEKGLSDLIEEYENKAAFFDEKMNKMYYEKYKELKN